MTTALNILTKPDDTLAKDIIARQRSKTGLTVDVVDLTVDFPDYADLLQRIFSADSVAVW